MNGYDRVAYRVLGRLALRHARGDKGLGVALLQANRPERPEMFLAALYATSILSAAGTALVAGLLLLAVPRPVPAPIAVLVLTALPLASAGIAYGIGRWSLVLAAQDRGTNLDANLLHGLNYMLALTASGMQPHRMFKSLAKQPVYGVLSEEAGLIYRDITLLGYDLITAIKNAIERSPSEKFREFLQGAVSTFASGVQLEDYLKARVAHYQRQEVEDQRKFLDTLGVIAESFLVIVVAAPLFLITLLAVMSINQGDDVITWGYGLALLYLPLCQAGVLVAVKGLTGKVDA